jgi:hypothetical protein
VCVCVCVCVCVFVCVCVCDQSKRSKRRFDPFTRRYDHGSFVPLMIIYPEAKIPVLQVSLLSNMNPEALLLFPFFLY